MHQSAVSSGLTNCKTLADMLKRCNITWVDKEITEEHFPVNPEFFTTEP